MSARKKQREFKGLRIAAYLPKVNCMHSQQELVRSEVMFYFRNSVELTRQKIVIIVYFF